MRKSVTVLGGLALAAVMAGCGSASNTPASTSTSTAASTAAASSGATGAATGGVTISARSLPGLGTVLVNQQGRTLYVFAPDNAQRVTCVSSCASVWPPVKLEGTGKPVANGAVEAALLSSVSDPEGGRVVTYHGWPLYTYLVDSAPGTATGQALNSSGGYWYVITAAGAVVKAKP